MLHPYSRSTAGFTLAEVLVALFVVALGLAGAASLQTLALRSAAEAARLSDGTRLAHSLAARMHANPAALALADDANPYLELDYDAVSGAPPAATTCYADATCNADDLARFDTYEIADTVAQQFPHGRVKVCRDGADTPGWTCDGAADAPLVVKLGWRTPGDAGDALPKLMLPLAGAAP